MKHKFKLTRLWVASLLLLLGVSQPTWADKMMYLDISQYTWYDNAYAHYWGGTASDQNVQMQKVPDETYVYYGKIPTGAANILFVRIVSNNWYNQTYDWNNFGNINYFKLTSQSDKMGMSSGTYVPKMKSLSLANNGTTTLSGSGTQADPYIIAAGATVKVKATAALQVDDSNPTFKYKYKVDGVEGSYGDGNNTYQFTAGTEAHTYAVTVRAYATYNSTDNTAIDASNTIYFKIATYTGLTISDNGAPSMTTASSLSSKEVVQGQSVTITKGTPAAGYELDEIAVSGGTLNGTTWTPDANNQSVTVKWKASATYSLVVAAGTGITSVSGGKSGQTTIPFDGGTISATVKEGYEFDKWTADPAANATFASATSASTTVTVDNGSVTVTANATEILSSVTTAVNAVGTTAEQTAPTKSVNAIGVTTTSSITASTAKTGYKFVGWTLENCTRTDGGSADAITITIKGLGNTNAATVTANYVQFVHSSWYMMGTNFGGWENPTTYEIGYPYRGMANVYYFPTSVSSYFKVHNSSKRYSIDASTTEDKTPELGKIYNLVQNETKSMTLDASNVWVIVKTTDTKKFAVINAPSTFYTVSVSGATDHGSYTLKDEAWDLATDQYSDNDTYVLKVTANSGYRAVLKVNGVATSWYSTAGGFTYKAKPSENTTLTVEYIQQYTVTHNYYSGCSSTMGTYTVKADETTINSGNKVDAGTVVTFAAEAKPGYQFDGWYTAQTSGTKESELGTYNKTINATTALYAKFSKKVWTVTVAADGNGTGTLDPVAGTYQVNQVDGSSFTATPTKGSWFEGWTITAGAGSWTSTTFRPTANSTITATFTKYTSSLPLEDSYHAGLITVTPNLDTHYPSTFTLCYELYKGEDLQDVTFEIAADGTVTFPVAVAGTDYKLKAIVHGGSDCNATIIDEFEQGFTVEAIYTVNFAVSPTDKGCSTDPASSEDDVELNTPFAISASAGTGYHFNKWVAAPAESFTFGTEEGDATKASTTATMTVATATSTITATFSPNTYSVHFNANCAEGTQQATGTMEDQSFEYDEAAKALTENAFVRLGYNFLGWSTDASATEATYTDKRAVQNLATESGAVVNLYAVWQLKEDCSITVTQPDASDGTITPSEKVTGANVEGTVYTYTFNPATSAVTFMNWTITNAICVDGTNERSNPVKIKTYGEATIRANVKENLVSVTLKVLPNDQWGYFNVNGNNVASGTVINVGSKTTATVLGKNTNFGYRFDHFEKTEGFDDLITYNETTGEMKGKGGVGKATIIAYFGLDAATKWALIGNWNTGGNSWTEGVEFRKHDDQVTKKIAYASLTLNGGSYEFKIKKPDGTIMGLSDEGEMNGTYHFGWKFNNSHEQGKVCKFNPTLNSTYVFRLDYTDENNPTVTLLYKNHWFPENTTVYFNNYNEANWGRSIIRFGCDGGMAEAYDMTLVPGTANLYSYTFPQGYEYFEKYHIVNNYGWTGAKDKTNETTYGINNIGEGDYKIGRSTEHMTNANAPGCVIRIKTDHYAGDYKVEYYKYDYWSSLESSRYNVTFASKTLTGGTLKVEQWENNDGSARTELNTGTTKVDQSRWITLTATPEIGYKFVKMSVTTEDGNTEDHYQTTWKYAVQQNITAITAEFEQVNKYTFYVKNTTDTEWNTNKDKEVETRDVYIYYDNGKSDGEGKVSYWGWPGLMATPMDNNHEWYKVEMTNAYFTIGNWILNNGVGPDCPQTIHYVADNGVPKFGGATMEGKYYEIVQKGKEFNTYELQAASTTPSFYRVVSEGGKYTSNVATIGEKVSFFATTAGAKLQKSGESGWTDVANITISKDSVWQAEVATNGLTNLKAYTGNYYIRTDGASGQWGEYKDPSKNNAMTYFTPRQGETYSYYWVKNLGKFDKDESSGSFNVKAKVANDYNDNLAGEIANDANTNIYGNINKTTNGSNVRFSYDPGTNAFGRAILSGSAEDSYLNIVGANIYSDVSCKNEFALNMDTYKNNPKACKLRDISDWVYEMTIYAQVPDESTAIGVDMYSLYNGNRSTLLNNKVIMATGTDAGTYKLRVTYDFKKNRITTSWSPSSQMITETMTVNADIQFLQNEKGDVSQITIIKDKEGVTVKSLEYLLYVLEIEDPGEGKRKEEHYRISLPFNCRVSDIYGIEGYVELNDAGQPISGNWGIQKYDGETRAKQGWYDNSPIQNFWKWLRKDEVMYAGQGYSISIDKNELEWSTIGEEVTRTICDANGTNCQDVTTTEDRAAHRLYFPSTNPGFDLANSTTEPTTYEPITCTKTQGNRNIYDSDWRFMGSTAYNNIKTDKVNNGRAGEEATPAYLYVLNSAETEYEAVNGTDFIYRSFGAYMFQFHGSIAWNIYTQSHPESQAPARRYSAIAHAPLKMHVDVMEGEEMAAHAFVELNDQATTGFDQKMDLTLMKSSKVARAYTTTEGIDYAANCLPFESTILPFTINTLHAGDYTLHLEGADNVAVYLIDYQLQTETLISAGNVEVELGKGSSSDRFALRFDVAASPTDSKNAKGETIINDGQKTQKLLINDNIYLINGGRIYNVLGVGE